MALAVVLKPNYLIFALAAALVTALYALGSRRLGALLVCAGLLAAPMAADRLARLALEKRTGFPLGAGAPQTTWLDEKELTERFLCEVVSLIHVHEIFSDALEQNAE